MKPETRRDCSRLAAPAKAGFAFEILLRAGSREAHTPLFFLTWEGACIGLCAGSNSRPTFS